jgi:hypothetical protein
MVVRPIDEHNSAVVTSVVGSKDGYLAGAGLLDHFALELNLPIVIYVRVV